MGVCINRYIDNNEKVKCPVEDRDQSKKLSSDSSDSKLQHQAQMVDNVLQSGLSGLKDFPSSSANYSKLYLSLLSGLPNEQDWALNVCTILSNEGACSLHLEQAPRLVDLLVAQAGVWREDDTNLKMHHLESWRDLNGRNVHRFWRSTLDVQNSELINLLGLVLGEPDPNEALLNLDTDLGTLNVEGQRVLRVALILHNLSFEKNNVSILVQSKVFMRFLLLSIHSSWANLKQTAYDTFANIAYEIKLCLEKDMCSRLFFRSVMEGLKSPDRFMSIRSMDILSQLCGSGPNEDIIPSQLDFETYENMVSLLTVHDIMLLFYTLEALYALSELGRYACDKIACVHGSIGILVKLLTLEPSQYGPSAEIKMKIVEILVPAEPDSEDSSATKESSKESTPAAVPVPTITLPPSATVSSETFAANWLKSSFEPSKGSVVPQNELYAEYVGACTKSGQKCVLNANGFANCIKKNFPLSELKQVQSTSGVTAFHFDGLCRKRIATITSCTTKTPNITIAVTSSSMVPKPIPKPSQSPILKAQLSAPTSKSDITTPTKITTAVLPKVQKPAVPPIVFTSLQTTPTLTQAIQGQAASQASSTLIKSLLASKVQQRNVQRQIVPLNVQRQVIIQNVDQPAVEQQWQVISQQRPVTPQKMVIISSGKMGSGLVRCMVPQMNVRNPLQATRLVPALQNSILQPKVIQPQTVIVSSASSVVHLNGTKSDTSIATCSKSSTETSSSSSVIQVNCIQNHSPSNSFFTANSDLQTHKDSNVNDQNFILSQIHGNTVTYRLARPDELIASSENRLFVRSKPDGLSTATNEQNGSGVIVNNRNSTCLSLLTQPTLQPKTSIDLPVEVNSKAPPLRNDEICKKSPLLNGLLDRKKTPLSKDILFNALVENGIEASDVGLELSKSPSPPVQSHLLPKASPLIMPNTSTSLNSIIIKPSVAESVSSSSNSIIMSSTSAESVKMSTNSVILSGSTLNSLLMPTSSQSVNFPVTSPNNSSSNSSNVVQIRTGQATFSGTAEVQADQKGVVRLHIESPENSNQGSDLSSISDIARTLECASEAISKTNAECNTQVPESTNTGTLVTTTGTISRPNQQIIVVTPALGQPQLQMQSPNIKFCILHTMPMAEESVDLVGMPQISLNQLGQLQQTTIPSVSTLNLKRPSNTPICIGVKKPRVDPQVLQTQTPVPAVNTITESKPVTVPPLRCDAPSLTERLKHTLTKVIQPAQASEDSSEKEAKTFSGLFAATGGPPSPATPRPATPTPTKANPPKLEYICEWKGCGLKFKTPNLAFLHASKIHTPDGQADMICMWEGCDQMKRKRFSLLTHIQDWHCNDRLMHQQALRRMQILQQGQTSIAPPAKPPPHPGYAPDAAVLAIKRHALQYNNPKELSEEKESPLTKSLRLTSALILRNLVMHSSLARTYVRRFEPELAYLAMSPVESAKAIAQCLSHLSRSPD